MAHERVGDMPAPELRHQPRANTANSIPVNLCPDNPGRLILHLRQKRFAGAIINGPFVFIHQQDYVIIVIVEKIFLANRRKVIHKPGVVSI